MKEAAEFAESTQILMNVSEFTDISTATDTLISAVQAFGYTAETSMEVVDLMNIIGNNYAISTSDLATSLTKSSASLVAAGGDLAEAAALTATANAIIQDADSVGTALKTTSLRLRGTSVKVLEEEGLDSDGAIESTSKLRSQVLATSGVDILTDTGAYKSTYQILLEIAEVWDQITDDKARAGLLELLAGKRNSSVIAALLQNPEDLKAAYEDAMNAEGSALKENERYLDSIQGRIDQFNNAMQAMWSNALDSDFVKGFVEFGTTLIKIVDDVGLLRIAFMGLGMYLTRGIDFSAALKPAKDTMTQMHETLAKLKSEMDDAIANDLDKRTLKSSQTKDAATKRYTDYKEKVKEFELEEQLNQKAKERLDLQDKLNSATEKYEEGLYKLNGQDQDGSLAVEAFEEMAQLDEQIKKNGMSMDDAKDRMKAFGDITEQVGKKSSVAFSKLGKGIKIAATSLKEFAIQMAVMYAVTVALEAITDIFGAIKDGLDSQIETAEEAQEKFEELNSELSDVKSELNSLNSELKTTKDRMDELISQGSLSFTEQEELNRLKAENAELERKIALNKTLEESLQKQVNSESINATGKYLNTSFGSESSKTERQEKSAAKGGKWGKYGIGAAGAIIGSIIAPGVGTLIGLGIGAFVGEPIGEAIGSAVEGAAYDAEQTVADAMDNMQAQRASLKKNQDEALANKDSEAYKNATEALQMYDKQMAQHISQIQANYNAMDWETATEEERKQMIEYADWLDKYSIEIGTTDAKSNAIARIFGEEATGGIAKARDEINKLKENLIKAKKSGEGVDEALAALEGFELNLSKDEVERLRGMGIYLYEVEDYFKEVVDTETEFIDNDLEDVAKDINKISDGLASLKSAFEEVVEEGILTAKTVMALKEELDIAKYSEVEEVTDAWREYLDIMMSGTATTEEMTVATEKLAQSIIEAALEDPNGLTPDTKFEYVAQLKVLGVENAEEYVDDLLQKNMVKELENAFTFDVNEVKAKFFEENKHRNENAVRSDWLKLSQEQIEEYAKQYGIVDSQITDAHKQEIIERYGADVEDVNGIIEKLEQQAVLQQKISDEQNKISEYSNWYDVVDGKQGFGALSQDIKEYAKFSQEYERISEETKRLKEENARVSWADDRIETWEKYDQRQAQIEENEAWLAQYSEQYQNYLAVKEQYDVALQEGIANGWASEDGSLTDQAPEQWRSNIQKWQEDIQAIAEDIDNNMTIDVKLKLGLVSHDELVDDIQNVFDTLANAQKEYTENGYMTVDTMQSLLKLEPKYLDLLVDENGNLNLTKENLYEVARARIIDLGLKQQNAIVDKALALATNGSKAALDEWIIVNQQADESMKDSISTTKHLILSTLLAKEAAGELPKGYTDNFMGMLENQLSAVQRVTDLALSDLGNTLSSSGNTTNEEAEDAFQKAMDYWENRIGAKEAQFEQVQHEIDMLEATGKKAGAGYFQEQLALLTGDDGKLSLLEQQLNEATVALAKVPEGSEDWWEIANTINSIEGEIDDTTLAIQDLNDAMADTHWYIFDESHDRLSTLTSDLENVRDILSNEKLFDDEGNFTKEGLGTIASYVQELGIYEGALADARKEMELFGDSYDPNKTYVDAHGNNLSIDSEQDWYEAAEKAEEKYDDYNNKVIETKYNIRDLYEQQIEAVEEYTSTLIDNYNDYIDSVKDALDAERDLYDFKKKVKNESKNISELERRIASLSNSTNASDIATRRKLEAELYEAKESLNDTYYDHSRQSQDAALDEEATAYETAMNAYIEGLRVKLEESTAALYLSYDDMSTETKSFVDGVTQSVVLNAGNVKQVYLDTGEIIDDCLVTPWSNASAAIGAFASSDGALGLMNSWTESKAGAPFYDFQTKVSGYLSKPWSTIIAEGGPVKTFKTSVNSVMSQIVSDVQSNVSGISGYISGLKTEIDKIKDTTIRITTVYDNQGGGGGQDKKHYMTATLKVGNKTFTSSASDVSQDVARQQAALKIQQQYYDYKKQSGTDDIWVESMWKQQRQRIKYEDNYYAKGTTGTKDDQWAFTDEFGPELTMYATPDGTLSFMRAGSTVVPADITANLVEWGKLNPDMLNVNGTPNINMISNAVNKPELNITFDSLIKAENITEETLPAVKKLVTQELNRFTKELNYALKGKGAR